jgi:cobalamin biosynthesis Mg chelatase CobN
VSGEYTITAIVPQVSGETDSADNTNASTEKVILTEQAVTPLPILEIMIVAVVIVIAIILTIWIIRRQRAKESPPEEA